MLKEVSMQCRHYANIRHCYPKEPVRLKSKHGDPKAFINQRWMNKVKKHYKGNVPNQNTRFKKRDWITWIIIFLPFIIPWPWYRGISSALNSTQMEYITIHLTLKSSWNIKSDLQGENSLFYLTSLYLALSYLFWEFGGKTWRACREEYI